MTTALIESPVECDIQGWIATMLHRGSSDLHLVAGSPPALRTHGRLQWLDEQPMNPAALAAAIRRICPPDATQRLDLDRDADFALSIDFQGTSRRFRANVFHSQGTIGCSLRAILEEIPELEWAGFPTEIAARIAGFRNGLVLFTGVTGSGKSTSMAMIIQMINEQGGQRIITIEEPIEYLFHAERDTVISQREVGRDVTSFSNGLKYGLRQDPDVMLVGEIRDRETAQMAISAAETGHLVFSTMHTRDAKGAITRLGDLFPQDAQAMVRTQLAMSLRSVVSQHLIPAQTEGDRRVLAIEVLFNTLPVASAIRAGKIEGIDDAILTGRSEGMIPLDESLRLLVHTRRITPESARRYSNDTRRMAAR